MSSSWTFSTLEFLNCCLKFNWELKHDQSWCNCLHEEFVWRNKYRLKLPIVSSGNLAGDRKSASWNPLDFTLLVLQGCAETLTAPDVDWNLEITPVDFVSEAIVKMTQVNIVCLLPPPPPPPPPLPNTNSHLGDHLSLYSKIRFCWSFAQQLGSCSSKQEVCQRNLSYKSVCFF